MRSKELTDFIIAREKVRVAKEAGLPRAKWTKDPILAKYRFCNVHREDDRVSQWIKREMRDPFKDHKDLWFMMVVARLLNLPESLEAVLPHILPWKPEKFRKVLHERKFSGKKNFNGAYIVSTNGKAMEKVDYLIAYVLNPLWAARELVRPHVGMWLAEFHTTLSQYDGLGSFMAAQVVADMKYAPVLQNATDWHTFAASGPGSRRGLNRVMGKPVDAPWPGVTWFDALVTLRNAVLARWGQPLHAQDLQNCLCEFDKYERVRLGEGTPKQLYKERV